VQADGSEASWDRTGNLLAHGPNRRESRLKPGSLRFQFDRIKLPGTGEWIDKNTLTNVKEGRAVIGGFLTDGLETEFGVVGQPSPGLQTAGSVTNYGNGYFNLIESLDWKTGTASKVDLYLAAGYGPWQTLVTNRRDIRVPNRPMKTVRSPLAGGGVAALSPPVLRRRGAEVEVTAQIPARFLARDASGRPFWSLRLEPTSILSSVIGPGAGRIRVVQYNDTPKGSPVARLRFRWLTPDLPYSGADSFRLMARPVETIYFRDVPTRPTDKTDRDD
jgi:hypothetical protein